MFNNYYLNLISQAVLFGAPATALNIWAEVYYFTHYPVLVAWLSSISVASFTIAIFSTIYGTVQTIRRLKEKRTSKNIQYVKSDSNGNTTIIQKSSGDNVTQIAIQNNYYRGDASRKMCLRYVNVSVDHISEENHR